MTDIAVNTAMSMDEANTMKVSLSFYPELNFKPNDELLRDISASVGRLLLDSFAEREEFRS